MDVSARADDETDEADPSEAKKDELEPRGCFSILGESEARRKRPNRPPTLEDEGATFDVGAEESEDGTVEEGGKRTKEGS